MGGTHANTGMEAAPGHHIWVGSTNCLSAQASLHSALPRAFWGLQPNNPPCPSAARLAYALTATLPATFCCSSGLTSGVFFSAGGTICQNLVRLLSQSARMALPLADPVFSTCAWIRLCSWLAPAADFTRCSATISVLTCKWVQAQADKQGMS